MRKLTKEFQSKSIQELEKEAQKIREEVAKLALERRIRPAKDSNTIAKKKKRLAVILTLVSEKRVAEMAQK